VLPSVLGKLESRPVFASRQSREKQAQSHCAFNIKVIEGF
jgi:hypothetical protein